MSGWYGSDEREDAPVFVENGAEPDRSRRTQAKLHRKGRHTAAKRPEEKSVFHTVLMVLSVAVLAGLLLAGVSRMNAWSAFKRQVAEDRAETLAQGLTVDGVQVGGFTRKKAQALLASPQSAEVQAFTYRIHVQDKISVMTEKDLPVGSDLNAVLSQAWSLSRRLTLSRGETVDSPFAARARLRSRLRQEGAALSSMTGYDVEDVSRYAKALAQQADREPVNASLISVDFMRRDFGFSDDVPGLTLDQEGLTAKIAALLASGATDADIEAPVTVVPAPISRLRLKNTFGCLEVRSFETETPGGDGAVRAVVTALNGAIIPSGETASLRGLLEGSVENYASAPVNSFATALFDAGLCAGLRLAERHPQLDADEKLRGLEAALDAEKDLRLQNAAQTPFCVLCYYTPMNGRGTRGSVTLEVYGLMRQGGETAELNAKVTETLKPGTPEVRIDPGLEPGTTLLRREARDGARVDTVLVKKVNGKAYSTEIVCSALYPAVSRLIEKGP